MPADDKDRWDVHEHKDELMITDLNTICHPEKGQLCICEYHYYGVVLHPIAFKDAAAAAYWIENGTIANLQQSLSCLQVGFDTRCFIPREEK